MRITKANTCELKFDWILIKLTFNLPILNIIEWRLYLLKGFYYYLKFKLEVINLNCTKCKTFRKFKYLLIISKLHLCSF